MATSDARSRRCDRDVRVRECAGSEEAEGHEETLGKGDARIAVRHCGPAVEHEVREQVPSFIVGV